jgi:hypothetical protein
MFRHAGFWKAAAAIFTVINVAGIAYAAVMGEVMHAATHVGLLLGTVFAWQFFSPRRAETTEEEMPVLDSQIRQLQYSLDAIALEVERIGESQRFINKLQAERSVETAGHPDPE